MRSFIDKKERTWYISLNVAMIKKLKASPLEIDLITSLDGSAVQRLADDPVTFVDMIYLICKEQCDERGVTDEDFGSAMGGDVIDAASIAFLEELVDFFPQQKREALRKILARTREMTQKTIDRTLELVSNPAVENAILQRVEDEAQRLIDELNSSGS